MSRAPSSSIISLATQLSTRGLAHAATIAGLLSLNFAFRFAFARSFPGSVYALILYPGAVETIRRALAHSTFQVLLPLQYDSERWHWGSSLTVLIYLLQQILSPFAVSILLSSVFLIVAYLTVWCLFQCRTASITVAWLWIFGTQLTYMYTTGIVVGGYIFLSYILLNFVSAYRLMFGISDTPWTRVFYLVMLALAALSSEVWLNYGLFLVFGSAYLFLWHLRHESLAAARGSRFVLCSSITVLICYLGIRLQVAHPFVNPGVEDELVFTYPSVVFMVEDVIGNFFTFLYTSLTNFLPPAVVASNSLVYYGPDSLVREQHGYHSAYSWLVPMNHLFFWRYYAGVVATVFCCVTLRWLRRSWQNSARVSASLVLFSIMILTGFSTHLLVKFRPYNSVPALPYKAIVSILGVSLLIGYLLALAKVRWRTGRYRLLVGVVLSVTVIAGFARPHMLTVLLAQVGLQGFSDPLGDTLHFLQKITRALKKSLVR